MGAEQPAVIVGLLDHRCRGGDSICRSDMGGNHSTQGREVCGFQDSIIRTHTRFGFITTPCVVVNKLWSTSSALADVLIVGAMTLLLRRESGKFTSFVLIRVVRLTIETNALTAALAITSLVLYAAFPNELYYGYALAVVGKAYSNTLLVSLNNRIYLRDHRFPEHGDSAAPPVFDGAPAITLTSLHFAIPEPQPRAPKNDTITRPITPRPLDLDNSSGDGISTE